MNPRVLIYQYENFIKNKQQGWMYDLLLSCGPPKNKYFSNWDLKFDTRREVQFISPETLIEIRGFLLNTEWCLYESMGLKLLHNHCKHKIHGNQV